MVVSQLLISRGFRFDEVTEYDLDAYLNVKRSCYKKYVDQYYGGWVEDIQIEMNTDIFVKTRKQSCFQKILLNDETVGFLGYDEQEDRIDGITIQMVEKAQNKGVGSHYLEQIMRLSNESNKLIFLKVFKSNPAQKLYERFGFVVYSETASHYLMRYSPKSS